MGGQSFYIYNLYKITRGCLAYYITFVIYARWLEGRYESHKYLINRNWGIIEEYDRKKQTTSVSSTIYFYLMVHFLLSPPFTDYWFGPEQSVSLRKTGLDVGLTKNFYIRSTYCPSSPLQKSYLLIIEIYIKYLSYSQIYQELICIISLMLWLFWLY